MQLYSLPIFFSLKILSRYKLLAFYRLLVFTNSTIFLTNIVGYLYSFFDLHSKTLMENKNTINAYALDKRNPE